MTEETTIKEVLEISKSLKDKKVIANEVAELKQEKARLEKEVIILKNAQKDEQSKFDKIKKDGDKQADELNSAVRELQARRSALASSTAPEIRKLEALKEQTRVENTALDNKQVKTSAGFDNLSKAQKEFESKIEVVKQIKELAEKL
jgi:hypothetical protein